MTESENKLKKIIFYLPSFAGGGVERNSCLLASEFVKRGLKVLMAVENPVGPNRELLHPGVTVCKIKGGNHLANVVSLHKIVKKFRPEIIYARVGLSPIKVLLSTVGIFDWKKIVISYHNLYDPGSPLGGRGTYQLSALLTRITGATIAVSKDIRDELVNRFKASKKKIKVVHNPVDSMWIKMQAEKECLSWLKGKRYILSAGRLIYQKDYPSLLRAFALILNEIDHELVIIGEGPLRKHLERLIVTLGLKERVYLPGYIPNPFPVYKGADLFVLSSIFEGFGNVLVEAMTLGLPVIATSCPGGPKEILEEGKYGTLVSVSNPDALSKAIVTALSTPPTPSLMRHRAQSFSVEKIAESYLAILEKSSSLGELRHL